MSYYLFNTSVYFCLRVSYFGIALTAVTPFVKPGFVKCVGIYNDPATLHTSFNCSNLAFPSTSCGSLKDRPHPSWPLVFFTPGQESPALKNDISLGLATCPTLSQRNIFHFRFIGIWSPYSYAKFGWMDRWMSLQTLLTS